jgi:hypothetical protein
MKNVWNTTDDSENTIRILQLVRLNYIHQTQAHADGDHYNALIMAISVITHLPTGTLYSTKIKRPEIF